MPENTGKDISSLNFEHMMISLISSKINVLIVGGGRAAFIKARTFWAHGCTVYIAAKAVNRELAALCSTQSIEIIDYHYSDKLLAGKHIIVAATDDQQLNGQITADCERLDKIVLTCSDFTDGLMITPIQRKTENIHFALHTKLGSPKTSVFLANKLKNELVQYDAFVKFVGRLRNKIKKTEHKKEIMAFVNTEDFYKMFQLGVHISILKMFYPEII